MKTNNIIKEGVESAKAIADSIGSPYGEGASYSSVFSEAPKLDIKRDMDKGSHLDDDDWKSMVEDIVYSFNSLLTTILENELGTLKEIQVLADKEQALETDLALQEIIKDKEETLRLLTG